MVVFIETTITPEQAAEWLEKRRPNRSIRQSRVEQLKEIILNGEWKQNAQPIIFDDHEELVDGQHRLAAIVAAGKAVQGSIAFGVKEDALPTIDTGIARTASDVLKFNDYSDTACLASFLGLVVDWERGNHSWTLGNRSARPQTILQYVTENPTIIRYMERNPVPRKLLGPGPAAFLYWLFDNNQPSTGMAHDFLVSVASGEMLEKGDAAYAFREYLLKQTSRKTQKRRPYIIALAIKSWNAYVQDRKIYNLRILEGERFPEVKNG